MTAKEFLKSKNIWLGMRLADMNAPENYWSLENILEEYHEHQVQELNLVTVTHKTKMERFNEDTNVRNIITNNQS